MTKLHTHKSSHCRSDLVDMIFGQSFLRNNFLSTDDKIYFTYNAKDEFYSDEIWIDFLSNYIVHRYFFPSKIPSEFSKFLAFDVHASIFFPWRKQYNVYIYIRFIFAF